MTIPSVTKQRINFLFPVEIINRELDFRLFLGCLAARETNRIWIGRPRVLYALANCMKGGVYVGKNLFGLPPNLTLHRYHNLRKLGFRIVHLDEEGAVHPGQEDDWREELSRRLDPQTLCEDDYLCTWGSWQRDFYARENPPCEGNIRVTGHPRFDMYKPHLRAFYEIEAQQLRAQHGDFLLVNTNFAQVNHHKGLARTFSQRSGYQNDGGEKRRRYFERWHHLTTTMVNFVRLINRLSLAFPENAIVIRPHPSENQEYYREIFDGIDNVKIIRSGSVGAWLLAARTMIHDGCTTAIEAHFAGVPVINYKSLSNAQHDLFLPNLFGARCESDDEVIEEVRRVLAGGAARGNEVPDAASRLLANFRTDSFAALLGVLHEIEEQMNRENASYLATRFAWQEKARGLMHHSKRLMKLRKRRRREPLGKFSGFEVGDLEARLNRIQDVTQTRVRMTRHSSELLSLEAQS